MERSMFKFMTAPCINFLVSYYLPMPIEAAGNGWLVLFGGKIQADHKYPQLAPAMAS